MRKMLAIAAVASLATIGTAMAQTTTTTPAPATPPGAVTHDTTGMPKMSSADTKAWIGKPVYSSDNKNLGDVTAVTLDKDGKVLDLQADIGGFLGIGSSRVQFKPDQFSFGKDRVDLKMTADQAKAMPKAPK